MHSYTLEDVRSYLSEQNTPANLSRKHKKSFWKFCKGFHIDGDSLWKGNRKALLSDEEKDKVFRECHGSERGAHMGRNKTLDKVSRVYYFQNMTEYVYGKIKSCDACQRTEKIKTAAETMTPIHSSGPWDVLGMDLIGPFPETENGHRYVVTITDLFTKWVEAYPVKRKSAPEIAHCILKLFYRFGPPKRIITDQGREFVNALNEFIFDTVETKHIVTSAYHPQSNGQDERTNRTLKSAISKLVNDQQNDWDTLLEPILFGIRTSKQSSTKVTPFYAMFGRNARLFSEIDDDEMPAEFLEATELSTQEHTERMKKLHNEISQNIKIAQEKQKTGYERRKNKGYKTFTFKTGQLVLKRNNRKSERKGQQLETDWVGPYEIVELNALSARLKSKQNQILKTKTSLVHLKPYLKENATDKKVEKQNQKESTTIKEVEKQNLNESASSNEVEKQTLKESATNTECEKQNLTESATNKKMEKQNLKESATYKTVEKQKYKESATNTKAEKQNLQESAPTTKKEEQQNLKESTTYKTVEKQNLVERATNKTVEKQNLRESTTNNKLEKQSLKESATNKNALEKQSLKESVTNKPVEKQNLKECTSSNEVEIQTLKESATNKKEGKQSVKESKTNEKEEKQILKESATNRTVEKHNMKERATIKRVEKQKLKERITNNEMEKQNLKDSGTNHKVENENNRKRKLKLQVQNVREKKVPKRSIMRDKNENANEQLELYIIEEEQVLKEMSSNVRKNKQKSRTCRNFNNDYDEHILCSKEWFTDREIDFAQQLLAERHRCIECLQSVLLLKAAEYGGYILSVSCGKFVQIINVSGNHWITFTGDANANAVYIYDSMGCHITEELKFIIAAIRYANSDTLVLQFIDCIQQDGIEDCGLFAIANATALCIGEEPSTFVWKQSEMRGHLLKEFRRGEIGLFPFTRRSRVGKIKREVTIMLCKCCRMPLNRCVMN